MQNRPMLSTVRSATILREMVSCRRDYRADDNHFFRVTDVWRYLVDTNENWKINVFDPNDVEEYRPQAAVSEFDNIVRLTVDRKLWERADSRDKLCNTILAHELAHLQLRHNARFASRRFRLVEGPKGRSIIPLSYYEAEADFGAVAFQCGMALLDPRLSAIELADRALCDVAMVRKVQRMVQLDVFRRELARQTRPLPRIVL